MQGLVLPTNYILILGSFEGLLGFLATVTSGLGELSDGTNDFTHTVTKVREVAFTLFRVRVVLFAKVGVFSEENLSNFVHGISESEELSLEVHDHIVNSAVVGLVKTEASNLEGKLVEAAGLLHVKSNLVELSKGLEDLDKVTREQELVKVSEVLVRLFTHALLRNSLTLVSEETLSKAV